MVEVEPPPLSTRGSIFFFIDPVLNQDGYISLVVDQNTLRRNVEIFADKQ